MISEFKGLLQDFHKLLQLNWLDFDAIGQETLNQKFISLKGKLECCVRSVTDNEPLDDAIQFEWEQFIMPVDTMFKIYQRRLEIDPANGDAYKQFADYLLLYGPDWEEEANQLLACVTSNNLQEAYRVALSVDYNN